MKSKSKDQDDEIPQLLPVSVLFIITGILLVIAILGVYYFLNLKGFDKKTILP